MELMTRVTNVLRLKTKGKKWAEAALPTIVDVNKQLKIIETSIENECAEPKKMIKEIKDKYQTAIGPLTTMDTQLRDRIMREYDDTESIQGETGELVFPQSWKFEIEDFKKVPKEYRMEVVDNKAVNHQIKMGVRKIPGLKIEKVRSLRVLTAKE